MSECNSTDINGIAFLVLRMSSALCTIFILMHDCMLMHHSGLFFTVLCEFQEMSYKVCSHYQVLVTVKLELDNT